MVVTTKALPTKGMDPSQAKRIKYHEYGMKQALAGVRVVATVRIPRKRKKYINMMARRQYRELIEAVMKEMRTNPERFLHGRP